MFLKISIYPLLKLEIQVRNKHIDMVNKSFSKFCLIRIVFFFITGTFNTTVDIKLRQWAEQQLPARSVECGWESLQQEFYHFMNQAKLSQDHDDIFDNLKNAVVTEAMQRHSWEDKVRGK